MARKTVFLTGASGSMGGAAFKELRRRRDRYDTVILVRPSAKNKKLFRKYEGRKRLPVGQRGVVELDGLKIVWGDLTNYEDVLTAVTGADYVLHPAAFIAPEADHNPPLAERINVGAAKNIVAAIKAQPNSGDDVRLVNIGSVAEYGDRLPPIHMVRAGDPLKPSVFDFYATTKIRAERIVIESGLKYWASIRQTYIAIPDAMSLMDPILYHQPLNTHIEFVTADDAGYGLVQCLEVPDDFWGRIYNMGGGPACRFMFVDYIGDMMKLLGMGDYRKIMKRNWFALRNFHCNWFADSSVLNEYLGHWRQSLEDHYQQVKDAAPWYIKLGKLVPKYFIKKFFTEKMTLGKDGTMYWVKNNNEGRIAAFYGSMKKFEAIPDWDIDMPEAGGDYTLLDHGYDDKKPNEKIDLEEVQSAAKFRGGECLSHNFIDMRTKLKWKCAFGHEFEATPILVLRAGHWCPECLPPPWDYDKIAKKNHFFAQIYYTNHNKAENNFYDEKCYEDIL